MKTNNNNSVFTTIGASNHSKEERQEHDYYATEPRAVELLLELEEIRPLVLEPCVGEGHIAKVLVDTGHKLISTDLIDRGYGTGGVDIFDYHNENGVLYCKDCVVTNEDFDIVTNPPYKQVNKMTEHMLNLLNEGCRLIQFSKLTFLESKARKELFKRYPLKTLHVSGSRLTAAKNGNFKRYKRSAIAYGWFVWEKGYSGDTIVKWFN